MAVMRMLQLPVSDRKWQHGAQICFATFIWRKTTKFANNSRATKAREKLSTDVESSEF
jgi:hypothetical protein